MLARISIQHYDFTAAGNHGEVAVYDAAGKMLVSSLRDTDEARGWVAQHVRKLPVRQPRAPRDLPPVGRSRITGY
jgi:hypothetical protein